MKPFSLGTSESSYKVPNLGIVRDVMPGDVYEFLYPVDTRAGHVHPKGSLLHVEDMTLAKPHHEISESGRNWVCRTQFGTSVWATLEQCLSRGLLKLRSERSSVESTQKI